MFFEHHGAAHPLVVLIKSKVILLIIKEPSTSLKPINQWINVITKALRVVSEDP